MKTKFRRATPADLSDVCDLVVACWQKHGNAYGIDFDAKSTIETVSKIIHNGICIVGDGACAGGTVFRFPYNYNAFIGNIVFWSFIKPKGVLIFDAIADEFKNLGATHLNCASHFPDNRTGEFYLKRGLKKAEIQYIGNLK